MADGTSYTVEVYDPTYNFGDNPEDNWMTYGGVSDTFADVQEDLEKASMAWRNVRVVQHTLKVVAEYKDGQVSG